MVNNHFRWDFIGLSTDVKPTADTSSKVTDGSTFYCSDNSKLYIWYKDQGYEQTVSGGGGGGSYSAGDGIDITNNTISVDTDIIQEKLTAGTGIDITDNTISATGGGGVTPVQTTGTSTTDVMSQNATTSMVYADPSMRTKILIGRDAVANSTDNVSIGHSANTLGLSSIAIGNGARARKQGAVAIGAGANVENSSAEWSVALGSGATCSRAGEVNVGTGFSTHGYNSTNYRIIGGVHDGVDVHDAMTVGQANALIDAINTALSINIPHIGD